jgi:hypothetical protein
MSGQRIGKLVVFGIFAACAVIIPIVAITQKSWALFALEPFAVYAGMAGLIHAASGKVEATDDPLGVKGTYLGIPEVPFWIGAGLLVAGIAGLFIARAVG